eukprot:1969738-Amphidinium_carterae.2
MHDLRALKPKQLLQPFCSTGWQIVCVWSTTTTGTGPQVLFESFWLPPLSTACYALQHLQGGKL